MGRYCLCGFYPGICLTTEEKAQKNPSQGSRRVPAGTMKIHKYTITYSGGGGGGDDDDDDDDDVLNKEECEGVLV